MPDQQRSAATDVHDVVGTALASEGQRYTSGRKRLVELLVAAGRPVSLPDLLSMDSQLPQSSIYRNLDALEQQGLVRRISVGTEHARYELAERLLGHHHHLICVGCGVVQDVTLDSGLEDRIDSAMNELASAASFTVFGHTLDLHGHCADCHQA